MSVVSNPLFLYSGLSVSGGRNGRKLPEKRTCCLRRDQPKKHPNSRSNFTSRSSRATYRSTELSAPCHGIGLVFARHLHPVDCRQCDNDAKQGVTGTNLGHAISGSVIRSNQCDVCESTCVLSFYASCMMRRLMSGIATARQACLPVHIRNQSPLCGARATIGNKKARHVNSSSSTTTHSFSEACWTGHDVASFTMTCTCQKHPV